MFDITLRFGRGGQKADCAVLSEYYQGGSRGLGNLSCRACQSGMFGEHAGAWGGSGRTKRPYFGGRRAFTTAVLFSDTFRR